MLLQKISKHFYYSYTSYRLKNANYFLRMDRGHIIVKYTTLIYFIAALLCVMTNCLGTEQLTHPDTY